MYSKPDMIIGGEVKSWTSSIPGPKYSYSCDLYMPKAPVYTMREKPDFVVGSGVPSWIKSIPGPKYTYDLNYVRERQPVFSMQGRTEAGSMFAKTGVSDVGAGKIDECFDFTKPKPPSFSMSSKTDVVCGGPVPSWVKSIPGPKYTYDTNCYREKRPNWSMGKRLKSEGELMSVRSPGPSNYHGPAINSKKQCEVDSTRRKSFSTGFGIGSRWNGPAAELVRSGAMSRFDKPRRR